MMGDGGRKRRCKGGVQSISTCTLVSGGTLSSASGAGVHRSSERNNVEIQLAASGHVFWGDSTTMSRHSAFYKRNLSRSPGPYHLLIHAEEDLNVAAFGVFLDILHHSSRSEPLVDIHFLRLSPIVLSYSKRFEARYVAHRVDRLLSRAFRDGGVIVEQLERNPSALSGFVRMLLRHGCTSCLYNIPRVVANRRLSLEECDAWEKAVESLPKDNSKVAMMEKLFGQVLPDNECEDQVIIQ